MPVLFPDRFSNVCVCGMDGGNPAWGKPGFYKKMKQKAGFFNGATMMIETYG
jgi:hypothetical protein